MRLKIKTKRGVVVSDLREAYKHIFKYDVVFEKCKLDEFDILALLFKFDNDFSKILEIFSNEDDFREKLERSLKKLETECKDFLEALKTILDLGLEWK